MLSGEELGLAIRKAMALKGVGPTEVAKHFKIAPPSVSGWVRTGRVSKNKISGLVEYFAKEVGPEHWGLSALPAAPKFGKDSVGWAKGKKLTDAQLVVSDLFNEQLYALNDEQCMALKSVLETFHTAGHPKRKAKA